MSNGEVLVALLGAGREQLPALRSARSLGLKVVALDGQATAPGLKEADQSFVLDLSDEAEVIELLAKSGISAVIPAPIGRMLTTVGAVNDALGLRGTSAEAARACVDKARFDRVAREAGLRRPHQKVVRNRVELLAAVQRLRPCIVKPSHGSGSRGVVAIGNDSDASPLLARHLDALPPGQLSIVEEEVVGREVGIDGFVDDGRVHVLLVRDKVLTPRPARQELAFAAPAPLTTRQTEQVESVLQQFVTAIGLQMAPIHADVILCSDGPPVIIEAAPRPSGMFLSDAMVPAVCGIDFLGDSLRAVLGRAPAKAVRPQSSAAVLRMLPGSTDREAARNSQEWTDMAASLPGVLAVWPPTHPQSSHSVASAAGVMDRGLLLVGASTVSEAWSRSDAALAALKSLDEPVHNIETEVPHAHQR